MGRSWLDSWSGIGEIVESVWTLDSARAEGLGRSAARVETIVEGHCNDVRALCLLEVQMELGWASCSMQVSATRELSPLSLSLASREQASWTRR